MRFQKLSHNALHGILSENGTRTKQKPALKWGLFCQSIGSIHLIIVVQLTHLLFTVFAFNVDGIVADGKFASC